jgi:hypothetical protein
VADFNVNAEVNTFKDLDHMGARDAAARHLHEEFCGLTAPNRVNVLTELVLAGGNTGSPWIPVFENSGLVGLQPPEKDITVSLKCAT